MRMVIDEKRMTKDKRQSVREMVFVLESANGILAKSFLKLKMLRYRG